MQALPFCGLFVRTSAVKMRACVAAHVIRRIPSVAEMAPTDGGGYLNVECRA
jgi:hypothetical protein